ncbi:MAG: hypothetical protein KC543_07380, partial [Myxococcales bacterium]|nr:hypothetical protein [Myxococcales bacterium]
MTPRDGDPTDDPRAGEGEARRASETPARYAPLRVPIDGPDDSRAPGAGNSFAPGPAGDDDVEILVEVADDVSREELEWLESTTEPRFDLLSTSPPPTPPAASEPARPTEDVAAPPSVAPLAPTAGPAEEGTRISSPELLVEADLEQADVPAAAAAPAATPVPPKAPTPVPPKAPP